MKPIYFTLKDALCDIKDTWLRNEIEYLLTQKIEEIKEDIEYEYEEQIEDLNEEIKYLRDNMWDD